MAHNTSGTGSVVITESNVINRKNNYARQTSQTTLKLRNPTPENQEPPKKEYKWDIRWRNVFFFIYLHYALTRGLYILFTFGSKPQTFLWTCFLILASGLGITAGAHRLWAHKTFKAKTPLRIILATLNLIAFENHIYEWVRDHRVHHKFTDTDADPHNSKRGFFFSHMGWLMVRKQEEVKTKGKVIDMSDLEQDWVVMFQKKYYAILMPLFCLVIPTVVPIYFWNEDPWVSWYLPTLTRYCVVLHGTWSVNSAAHMWGTKPYDKRISPVENVYVAIFAYGEGWHNYHHAFPWDYKTSELSAYSSNYTKAFIDFFARIGWAYDLKTVKPELIAARAKRIGDGSHQDTSSPSDTSLDDIHQVDGSNVWGWEDRDLSEKDKSLLDIVNLKKITT